ncbi:hypothetical protein ACSSV8_004053 [Roseovarius sp. MBR-79]|jgi:type III restriction enzyme
MQLKNYQTATLAALDRFLTRSLATGPADAFGHEAAHQADLARLEGRVFAPQTYKPLTGLPDVPYVCLRLPTGGGKTLLAAECIGIAASRYLRRPYPLTCNRRSNTRPR